MWINTNYYSQKDFLHYYERSTFYEVSYYYVHNEPWGIVPLYVCGGLREQTHYYNHNYHYVMFAHVY